MNLREYRQMYAVEDYHWWYVALHQLILTVVGRMAAAPGRLRILDAGCGTGRLCQLLEPFGFVAGCDLSAEALHLCRERGLQGLFRADLNRLGLREGSVDLITSIDTLYHRAIIDERAVLESFYRALTPGGTLIINLVAFEFLRSSHDRAVHTRRRYTKQEVAALLTGCGFRIESISYRLGLLFIPIAALRLVKRLLYGAVAAEDTPSDVTPPNRALNRLLLRAARWENPLVLSSSVPFGTSVFAVARRPVNG